VEPWGSETAPRAEGGGHVAGSILGRRCLSPESSRQSPALAIDEGSRGASNHPSSRSGVSESPFSWDVVLLPTLNAPLNTCRTPGACGPLGKTIVCCDYASTCGDDQIVEELRRSTSDQPARQRRVWYSPRGRRHGVKRPGPLPFAAAGLLFRADPARSIRAVPSSRASEALR